MPRIEPWFVVVWLGLYAIQAADTHAQKLYDLFVPPCCWRGSLALHQSPAADQLRQEIDALVKAGKSDEQVKTQLVREFGRQILRTPEGVTGKVLFAIPLLGTLLALAGLSAYLRRLRGLPTMPTASVSSEVLERWQKAVERQSNQWEI